MTNSVSASRSCHMGRKYITVAERARMLERSQRLPTERRLFIEVLAWTGARVSEALSLTPAGVNLDDGTVTLPTLKRRKPMTRDIPLPPEVLDNIVSHFELKQRLDDGRLRFRPLWTFSRVTGWRLIKKLALETGIVGVRASPRGLRHGFGTGTLQAGVPLTVLKRWMGHARLTTTEIYTDFIGPDEAAFARLFWQNPPLEKLSPRISL